ncbi:3-oxoacyl-[acyl-carrier protein] reductase [Sinorhizobium fredii]|uniref:3-oxoacyl-[acyl-carrier-protein] reductase FabG n=1 Tax=Sinorhizobium fredii (strain USDA 257) TaxID=1185652 RepID=I3X384_SINF2|nr:SDR family NAD(P)-dependent oxidoreductase [Sinorhizobium fredii]AFL50340.1 3-oxoacyl-[acyl-carrier-protein] reductase FabG [Sinorhizobium fredii USDA 257]
MRGLEGKIIILTGGAQGIGKSTALRLAEERAVVIVADRNLEGAEAVAAEIRSSGGKARSIQLDVSSKQSWQDAVATLKDEHGGVDGLVNNAGVTRDKSLLKMAEEDWDLVIDVNLKGAWLGCQAVVPLMVGRNGGSIVNLSSESRWGAFGQSNYASAKAGLVGLTRTVALEQARNGIRVNAIAPGTTMTPMVEAVPEDIRKGWLDNIPLRREAQPSEIAAAIVFLLSDDASYVTGQILGVNGGSAL